MTYVAHPPTYQAQIDALTAQTQTLAAQIGALQMAASLPQASLPDPVVAVTATTTLTRPAQSTVREVKPTANTVVTLYPATGSGIKETFDVSALGGFTFAVALNASDSYDANNAAVAAAKLVPDRWLSPYKARLDRICSVFLADALVAGGFVEPGWEADQDAPLAPNDVWWAVRPKKSDREA